MDVVRVNAHVLVCSIDECSMTMERGHNVVSRSLIVFNDCYPFEFTLLRYYIIWFVRITEMFRLGARRLPNVSRTVEIYISVHVL